MALPILAKSRAQFSKVEPRKLAPYEKKVETTKFLPPSNVNKKFSVSKFDTLLTSLVGSTANLQRITKKGLGDAKKSNKTKDNIKQKLKRQRNEEKIESKKTVAKVSKPMKLTVPSLFNDIFKMGGRLVLSLGIMELLKFLDPEKRESIFGFLVEHLDKIILGALGVLAATFVASFLPVISMVGTILTILSPLISIMAAVLVPIIAAGAVVGAGYVLPKVFPEIVNEQERKIDEAEGTREEKIRKLEEQKKNLKWWDYITGVAQEVEEQLYRLKTGKTKSYGKDFGQSDDPLYKDDDKRRETSTEVQEPLVDPQAPTRGLSAEELKQYNRAYANKNNFFAKGKIKSAWNKMTPEQKASFLEYAKTQGHDWSDYGFTTPAQPEPKAEPQTSLKPGDVKKVIIGAGHAEDPNRPGSNLGTDGRPVQGTADDGSSGSNTPANATGVTESQLTRYIVDKLKAEVDKRGLNDKIGFRDIYSWGGLKRVPREVEAVKGQQYVDIHADARGFGKAGVLPSANESATDRSLMNEFGRYNPNFDPSSKGVTAGGGTLLEIGRIDGPKLRALLLELKSGKAGPATKEMIDKILRGILPGISSSNIKPVKPPNNAEKVSSTAPYEKQGLQVAILEKKVLVPGPSSGGGGGGTPPSGPRGSGGSIHNENLSQRYSQS